MGLKFDVNQDMRGYSLLIDTEQTNIEVGATRAEMRRLFIDLAHELDGVGVTDMADQGQEDADTQDD